MKCHYATQPRGNAHEWQKVSSPVEWRNCTSSGIESAYCMYSQSHLGWHFRMLFQSSKLKARSSLFTESWQKRRSSFELWAFENVIPSGIGCTIWPGNVHIVCTIRPGTLECNRLWPVTIRPSSGVVHSWTQLWTTQHPQCTNKQNGKSPTTATIT